MIDPQVTFDTGSLIVRIRDEESVSRSICRSLSTFHSLETGELIGCRLWDLIPTLHGILEAWPGFRGEMEGGCVRLDRLLTAILWSKPRGPDQRETQAILALRAMAERIGLVVELPDPWGPLRPNSGYPSGDPQ